MTHSDPSIITAVLRHNGIPDAEHEAHISQSMTNTSMTKRALKNYRAIYASLSHEEKVAAHGTNAN